VTIIKCHRQGLFQHFPVPLSVQFHQCSILISSPPIDAIYAYQHTASSNKEHRLLPGSSEFVTKFYTANLIMYKVAMSRASTYLPWKKDRYKQLTALQTCGAFDSRGLTECILSQKYQIWPVCDLDSILLAGNVKCTSDKARDVQLLSATKS